MILNRGLESAVKPQISKWLISQLSFNFLHGFGACLNKPAHSSDIVIHNEAFPKSYVWQFTINKHMYTRISEHMERKTFHFFQILYNHIHPKVIVISIVDLQKTNNFAKFGGYCSKNAPATPLRSLKWSRVWQAYFLSCHFQIWQKVEISWVQKLVKIWCWYLKPLLSNSKSTNIYHLP